MFGGMPAAARPPLPAPLVPLMAVMHTAAARPLRPGPLRDAVRRRRGDLEHGRRRRRAARRAGTGIRRDTGWPRPRGSPDARSPASSGERRPWHRALRGIEPTCPRTSSRAGARARGPSSRCAALQPLALLVGQRGGGAGPPRRHVARSRRLDERADDRRLRLGAHELDDGRAQLGGAAAADEVLAQEELEHRVALLYAANGAEPRDVRSEPAARRGGFATAPRATTTRRLGSGRGRPRERGVQQPEDSDARVGMERAPDNSGFV